MSKRVEIIFGLHPVLEALRSGKDIQKILLGKPFPAKTDAASGMREFRSDEMRELRLLAAKREIKIQHVPPEKLTHLTGKNHQGIIAIASPVTFQSAEHLLPQVFEKGAVPLVIILDRITDVMNFGAIIRSAECAGVDFIIIPDKNMAQINSDTIKSSSGALFNIPICRSANLVSTVNYIKMSGLQVVGCTEKADKTIYETDYSLPTAIIVGSEEEGISTGLIKSSDTCVRIPMKGKTGSLNVSVAAGIILFEAARQREINGNEFKTQ